LFFEEWKISTKDARNHRCHNSGISLKEERKKVLKHQFDDLACDLKEAGQGRRIIYMQSAGNAGDALIRYGSEFFFKAHGIRYHEFDMQSRWDKLQCMMAGALDLPQSRRLFLYAGGGAWSATYDMGYRNVFRQSKFSKDIFVLPSTLDFGLKLNFPIYARDRFESLKYATDGKFCHDLAFFLALENIDLVLPNRQPPVARIGLALRTDRESGRHRLAQHPMNRDISATGNHLSDPRAFLRQIDQFEHVITDRLHVAIGALILGKKVSLAPGNYFKIKAIYRSSIEGNFENAEFLESEAALADLVSQTFD
jgi:exopolysaccharide biosynthesis predicted pyruvyltransferase EpsI